MPEQDRQKYRITFKCSCGKVFRKITTDNALSVAACPDCKKKDKKIRFQRIGDGPVSASDLKPRDSRPVPNTIYKCKACSAIVKVHEDVEETSLTECPACASPDIVYKGKISHEITKESANRNKAIDTTANIVMEDYKLGDLKDDVKLGESMAPRLDPKRQTMADNMFSGRNAKNPAHLGKLALSGAFSKGPNPMGFIKPETRPPIRLVNAN